MQRTFPKKTTVNNNSKSKKGRWKRDRQKYVQPIFDENDNDECNNDEIEVKLKQQFK